jgi:hypothetical protein
MEAQVNADQAKSNASQNATMINVNSPTNTTAIAGGENKGGGGDGSMQERSYRESSREQQRANMF